MSNVFKEPIICELKPSYQLATGFFVITIVPLLSCLVLLPRFPLFVLAIIAALLTNCLRLINRYAIRTGRNGIRLLRLHNDIVLITYNNLFTKSVKIAAINVACSWVVIELADSSEKIIVDKASAGTEIYSQLVRQIKSFKADEVAQP